MRHRVLPLLIALLLLPATPGWAAPQPSSGEGPQTRALGCSRDPAGDAGGVDGADLVDVCLRYFDDEPRALVVSIDAVAPLAPLSDPAWLNPGTAATLALSIDDDDEADRMLTIVRDDAALVATVTTADGTELPDCGTVAQASGGFLRAQMDAACIDDVPAVRFALALTYEETPGAAVAMDVTPDDSMTVPLPARDEPPVCANPIRDSGQGLTISRLACGVGGTEPISQAVATSQFIFDDPATPVIDPYMGDYAVIARDDDFADALSGSSLSFGQGPLLFTYSPASAAALGRDPGELADITRAELLRTVPRGRTVYLLGGTAALDAGLDAQLEGLGYDVVRFAGAGREGTARLVSQEVSRLVDEFTASTDFVDTNMVLIATRGNWPDAVVAGSVGAFWGMPILLADVEPPVHPETLAALDELRPDYIHVIGGTGVISNAAGGAIGSYARERGYALGRPGEDLSGPPWGSFCGTSFVCRWGGANRIQTGGNVGQLNRDMVSRFGDMTSLVPQNPQQYAAAVQLGNGGPNYAYALAAATVSGRFGGAVFIPTENQTLSPDIVNALCNTPGSERFVEEVEEVVLVADSDVLSDGFAGQIRDLIEDGCPPPGG